MRLAFGLAAALAACAAAPAAPEGERGTTMDAKQTPGTAVEVLDPGMRSVVAPDAAVRQIAADLKFTEGPAWMDAPGGGCLLFSDIPADTIYRWTEAKGLEVFRKPSHNSNGNTTDRQGRLVTCEHGSRTLTRTEKDATVVTLASTYKGKRLNSPNDVAARSDGTIWFTDPPYGIRAAEQEQPANYVFRLDPGAKEPAAVAADFPRPNGICFSPDEKYLYVADSDGKVSHIRRFRVTPENALADGVVFAKIAPPAPDGIRCDRGGRLWVTAGDGVHVLDPEGKLIGKIRLPVRPANCAFGDKDRKTLYITARQSVYAVRLLVAGLP
jgi:sugar lactone lactonase YvrE